MLLLLKSTRNIAEVQIIFSWCFQQGFRIERAGGGPRPITPDMLQIDEPLSAIGAIEWGHFRTVPPAPNSPMSSHCFVDRVVAPYSAVGACGHLFSGALKNDASDALQKAGAAVHQTLEQQTNLLILGNEPDRELVARARAKGSVLIWEEERYERLKNQLKEEWGVDSHGLNQELRSELRHRSRPLRAALKTRDPVAVDSAVDLFLSGAHGVLVDALVDCVDWNPGTAMRAGQLVPNPFFSGSGPLPSMERALRRIIAKAPPRPIELDIWPNESVSPNRGDGWLDCSTLSAFTALEWLQCPSNRSFWSTNPRLKTTD